MVFTGSTGTDICDSLPPLTRTITEKMVIAYEELFERVKGRANAKLSFHADRNAASQTMYCNPIAQGVLTEAFFSVLITGWLGEPNRWLCGGTLDTKFIAPVWYEDKITYRGEVTGIEGDTDKQRLLLKVWADNQDGKKVIVGQASVLI